MQSAEKVMELQLDNLPNEREILLSVGAENARDLHALCNDVAAMIFPSAIFPPTDATISAVTDKLVKMVSDIEDRLQPKSAGAVDEVPVTWSLLARSGFLREPELIDFILARVAEDRLELQIGQRSSPLAANLLSHANDNVAQAAQSLLAADSLHRRTRGQSYLALRPELLHQLCWRVVAATEVGSGERNPDVLDRARALLASYDEGQTTQAAASKVTHFAGEEYRDKLFNPEDAGLHLYVANIAQMLGIEHDHVLQLIDSRSSAPLSIMLRAVDCEREQAMAIVYLFNGFSLTPRDIELFDSGYEAIPHDLARIEVRRWGHQRTQYLAFQQTR